jgi:hypothetical protein
MNSKEIFLQRMACIVFIEKRPSCYIDFLTFEFEGKTYTFRPGTIRNIFSQLRKHSQIEVAFRSKPSFYTLPGAKFKKPVTLSHEGDSLNFRQNELLHLIQTIPMDDEGIHNIRLRFKCPSLSSILPLYSDSENFIENIDLKSNKDITLCEIDLKDFVIKATVHKTDFVSVAVAWSQSPVPIDLEGFARLSSGLTRLEERLQRVLDEYLKLKLKNKMTSSSVLPEFKVPSCMTWTVTMWHFGRDSLTEYSGERFHITWEDGLKVFRVYSKAFTNKKKMKIREEVQEYPNKSLEEAFKDKINEIEDRKSKEDV